MVTATRTPQPLAQTGESLTVISAAELAARQIDFLTDALQSAPGVMIDRNGGPGQVSLVSIRGAEAGQTLILFDGVRINDPSTTDDTTMLGDLMANNVDRIELLRGPQSTLYGSDAIGGVVNVLTKRGGSSPFALTATAEGGALDTVHLNLAANGTADEIEYGVGLNYYDTRSISAADARNGNSEPDPYRNYSATGNVRIPLDQSASLDVRLYYVRARAAFDDGFALIASPPYSEVADSGAYNKDQLLAGYAGVNFESFGGTLKNRLAAIATGSQRDYLNSAFDLPGELNFSADGDSLRFEYQGIVNPSNDDEVTFGAETQRTAFRSNVYFAGTLTESDSGHSRITGGYVQAQHRFFSALTLTAGLRLDGDAEFGTHLSSKLAAAWQIASTGSVVRANFGDGFKAPSLFEDFSVYAPPPNVAALKPESAKGWEAGIDQMLLGGKAKASATYFQRDTGNLIDFFTCYTALDGPGCPSRVAVGGYYFNEGRTKVSGAEFSIAAQPTDTLSLTANYTTMSAVDRDSGRPLQRRPHAEANGAFDWAVSPDLHLGGSLTYVGRRFDDAGATVPLSSFALIDLTGSYALGERAELFARVENLFDRHYEPVFGYGAPGRTAFAGIRLRWP
ncbi:MAG: TonB-dependent receptor [Alphaproteobacteria bacterium]|nr:TonB-dependent receptor [Alphaproteobacteria bacterium]